MKESSVSRHNIKKKKKKIFDLSLSRRKCLRVLKSLLLRARYNTLQLNRHSGGKRRKKEENRGKGREGRWEERKEEKETET